MISKKLNKQFIAKKLGDSGCYFLSVVELAERIKKEPIDVIDAYDYALKKKWINDQCYMERPDLILQNFLGIAVAIKKSTVDYKPKANEEIIGCYEWKATGTTYYHFVLLDKESKKIVYDPLGNNNVVKNGKLQSLRVFKIG